MPLRHDPMAVAARVDPRGAPRSPASAGRLRWPPSGMLDVRPEPRQRRAVERRVQHRPSQHRRSRAEGGRGRGVRRRAACSPSDEGCEISMRTLARFEPVEFDADMIDLVEATAQRLGHSTRRMPSGAGHDAQMLARVCPTSMVFVPSVNGLSHNIAEYTDARRHRGRRQRAAAGGARTAPASNTVRAKGAGRSRRPSTADCSLCRALETDRRVDELVGDDVLGRQTFLRRAVLRGVDRDRLGDQVGDTVHVELAHRCRQGRWPRGRRP